MARYTLVLVIIGFLFMSSMATAQEVMLVSDTPTDCPFALPPDEVIGQTALCGELTVPENWQQQDGRSITLNYVVLKAQSIAPFPDPVIYLEGGPGVSALVHVPFLAEVFQEIRRYRDVIIYDQRGTAFGTPLFCPTEVASAPLPDNLSLPPLPTSADPEIQALLEGARSLSGFAAAVNCRPYFEAQGFDLSQYSTANSVRDLIAMMRTFGYEAYNIYGISYGTNVALELFRYYDENPGASLPSLRSGIIDGVVPPNVDTRGGQAYVNAYNILRVFEDCEADAACGTAFPNIRQRAVDLLLRIESDPLTVGDEGIAFDDLRRVLVNGLNYSQDGATGSVIGIGAQYFPLMIDELEQGITTTFVGLRDGTLPPIPETATNVQANEPFGSFTTSAGALAGNARDLADQIDELRRLSQRASAALSGERPLPEVFIQNVRLGITQMDTVTATFFPAVVDVLLAADHTRESLAAFGASFDPTGVLVGLMSDDDIAATYRLLEEIRPTISLSNPLMLDIIGCNDRYGSFDLESTFASYRSFEVPDLITKVDVSVNQIVACTVWGLTPQDATLRPPVSTNLPILVSNGSIDPETPVEWGEAAYAGLENAFFITFAYYPHAATAQFDCGPAVAAAFILDPSRMPETSCADDLQLSYFPFILHAGD
ncbi:MAG: alpha/beta hydrolase [Anaerolineae bacterium]|nr:alpha/beta hydrolase [Anaerolineae bacterium]NUQ07020.1 alpha/beta fold hydrolase [Anaerolineae bacterium]